MERAPAGWFCADLLRRYAAAPVPALDGHHAVELLEALARRRLPDAVRGRAEARRRPEAAEEGLRARARGVEAREGGGLSCLAYVCGSPRWMAAPALVGVVASTPAEEIPDTGRRVAGREV